MNSYFKMLLVVLAAAPITILRELWKSRRCETFRGNYVQRIDGMYRYPWSKIIEPRRINPWKYLLPNKQENDR